MPYSVAAYYNRRLADIRPLVHVQVYECFSISRFIQSTGDEHERGLFGAGLSLCALLRALVSESLYTTRVLSKAT